MSEYPKSFWVLTRAQVILEDNKEVINHSSEVLIGGTFDVNVAEQLAAILKKNENTLTMVRSDVQPLPLAVLEVMQESKERSLLDDILDGL
jgi:hypothetical protein